MRSGSKSHRRSARYVTAIVRYSGTYFAIAVTTALAVFGSVPGCTPVHLRGCLRGGRRMLLRAWSHG
eukprot:6204310-Pleurochrysis_carterae.AAC.3